MSDFKVGDYVRFDYDGEQGEGTLVGRVPRWGDSYNWSVRLEVYLSGREFGHEDSSGKENRTDRKYWNVPEQVMTKIPRKGGRGKPAPSGDSPSLSRTQRRQSILSRLSIE